MKKCDPKKQLRLKITHPNSIPSNIFHFLNPLNISLIWE